MAIESAIYTLLTGNTGVKNLISTRLYPLVIPQTVQLPAVSYQVITTERNYHHRGQSNNATPYIQITIEADSYTSAKAVGAAIRACLSGYKGTVGSVNPVVITSIFCENEYDGFNLETSVTTLRQDYAVSWKEI